MSETFSKVEVITGVARRRRFTTEQKLSVVNETLQPGMSISYVARRHGLSPSLVFRWRRLMNEGGKEAVRADEDVVAASEVRRLEERVRDLEHISLEFRHVRGFILIRPAIRESKRPMNA